MNTAAEAFVWLNGSLNDSTWSRVRTSPSAWWCCCRQRSWLARRWTARSWGTTAAGLGVPRAAPGSRLLVVAVALAAVATAAAGPVAFVAFVAGPIARRLLAGRVSSRRPGSSGR